MNEELDLEQLDKDITNQNKVEDRIRNLSQKVKDKADEADANAKARTEAETRALNAEKERDFYSSFADVVSQYPGAREHKDEILAKVKLGYSTDDAAVSILNKAGKLNPTQAPQPKIERAAVAGGSAVNPAPTGGNKPLNEMSREEKRQMLMEAEQRGDISMS